MPSEAASISVAEHAEVTLGATCSLLQVLLAKVHTHQFISAHQFVRATHLCLLAEYFKSESLLTLPACFTCVCKRVSVHASLACLTMCNLLNVRGKKSQICLPVWVHFASTARCLYLCPSVILSLSLPGHFQRPTISPQQTMCVRTCRLPNLLLQSYGWGTAEDILYRTD